MNIQKNIYLLFIFTFCFSCKTYQKVELPTAKKQVNFEEFNIEKNKIDGLNNLNWGLALSGGGIRSATYNMGAIKALYDLKILDSIQIISSVSGGGYLSYGIYTKYFLHKNDNKEFGHFTFNDNYFLKNVSEQQDKSKFLPNGSLIEAFFSPPNSAFRIYKNKIELLHGNGVSSDLKINSLNKYIEDGSIPYFIINATIASKNEKDWLNKTFEFTPLYMGNPSIGYKMWDEESVYNWSNATSISAANIKFKLLKKVPNFSSQINADYIPLSDGGYSENLGAIALIRRGVKNIIIVDATHNIDYSFDSYKKLKLKLKEELNLDLNIEEIDQFIENDDSILKHSVFKGEITSQKHEKLKSSPIQIYFIKMSLSEDINHLLESQIKEGEEFNNQLEKQTCIKYSKKNKCRKYDASKLIQYTSIDLNELAIYWVKTYSNHINNHPVWKRVGYKFPHTTTKDQTFYRDQLTAFIGLGYLQALELKSIIK